ncbi:hypothetical protein BS47DRAFT_1390354 [Hydnum rufescens UP504]|uniref:Uncharacterized protein n=1 Tax=Hydnum rufescens UP504 TaxID=1448309 RepID=A0A9P6B320_9AGAM|nr:hypothetical protein BS47DRAFT_1390354 [Hydnum rufescens UP504]
MAATVNVSLPDHLHAALPTFSESAAELPYELLASISRWTHSDDGKLSLMGHRLDLSDYLLISLLSGTTTSPLAKLSPYRSEDPTTETSRQSSHRRALTALLNALFSVLGVGVATWWMAGSAGWRPERRVLLALFCAVVVATSEGILYLIWASRHTSSPNKPHRLKDKKIDRPNEVHFEAELAQKDSSVGPEGLRHRSRMGGETS